MVRDLEIERELRGGPPAPEDSLQNIIRRILKSEFEHYINFILKAGPQPDKDSINLLCYAVDKGIKNHLNEAHEGLNVMCARLAERVLQLEGRMSITEGENLNKTKPQIRDIYSSMKSLSDGQAALGKLLDLRLQKIEEQAKAGVPPPMADEPAVVAVGNRDASPTRISLVVHDVRSKLPETGYKDEPYIDVLLWTAYAKGDAANCFSGYWSPMQRAFTTDEEKELYINGSGAAKIGLPSKIVTHWAYCPKIAL